MWDFLWDFPEFIQPPLAKWIDAFVNWLTVEAGAVFDAIGSFLLAPLLRLETFLLWLPWVGVVIGIATVAWWVANWRLSLSVTGGMVLIGILGLWDLAMQTLALIVAATLLAVAIGIPVGIAMARNDRLERIIRPILDMMQTMPSFVYLIPAVMLIGIGKVPALLATFVYAVPPVIRLTNLGIREVATDVLEAGQAFGSTHWQILFKIQLPLAMPTIMAGINQTIMMALAMVVIASMIGAGGLGTEVLRGIQRLEVGRGFNGGISIVILAIIIDRITHGFGATERE